MEENNNDLDFEILFGNILDKIFEEKEKEKPLN